MRPKLSFVGEIVSLFIETLSGPLLFQQENPLHAGSGFPFNFVHVEGTESLTANETPAPHNAYLALIDILGFSARILEEELSGGGPGHIQIAGSLAHEFRNREISMILFSDTIIFYTQTADKDSFKTLLEVCSKVLYRFTLESIPIRGAIARGLITTTSDGSFGTVVSGRPVIEAYTREQKLEWIGIVLAESTIRALGPELSSWALRGFVSPESKNDYLRKMRLFWMLDRSTEIPVKTEGGGFDAIEGWSVIPSNPGNDYPSFNPSESIADVAKLLKELKILVSDPKAQGKYQRTIDYLGRVRSRQIVANSSINQQFQQIGITG